jgi:photosystem II stability/assembly factor-like uncharacterized protein
VKRRTLPLLFLCLATVLGAADGGQRQSGMKNADGIIPGVVVLKLRTDGAPDVSGLLKGSTPFGNSLRAEGIRSVRRAFPLAQKVLQKPDVGSRFDLTRVFIAEFSNERDPVAVAHRLSLLPEVEYAEPKYYQRLLDTPNDPLLANQLPALTRLNALNGWSIGKGSHAVPIAAVDGGVYWNHEDLKPNLWINSAEDLNHNGVFDPGAPPLGDEDGIDQDGNGFVDDVIGWNFTTHKNDPTGQTSQPGSASHGTAVSSHFGASTNNGIGMAGTSWNCSLMAICAASTTGDNLIQFGYEGIEYAARMGARVINCSWGRLGGYSNFEQEVINAAAAAGALVMAAAGNAMNNNDYLPHYPASYRNVLGVGATNSSDDVRASFSNFGVSVPVFAPGVGIWSAFTSGGYGDGGSGTSYASPLVAGLAGILFVAHPSWTPQQVATQIRVTADSIDAVAGNSGESGKLGRGRVNFARALSENHAGLEAVTTSLRTPAGKTLFVRGDTVLVNISVRNLLPATANNVQFQLSSFNPELSVLSGDAFVAAIAPGQEVALPTFACQVSSSAAAQTVVLKLSWVSNGNEADAIAIRTFVYPSMPLWISQETPTLLSLYSVRAVNHDVAWACGGTGMGTEAVVLRTTNGGNIWASVTGNLPAVDLYCLEAVDADRAWVGTATGQIYATANGGASWAQQPYGGIQSGFIDGIRFFDTQLGYALGDPPTGSSRFVVLGTTDGGSTWNHIPNEPAGVTGEAGWNNSFWWSDPRHGWFGTNVSHIWRTADGGATWQNASSGGASSYALAFRDSLVGVAGHDNGFVVRSADGGLSWSGISFPSTATVTALAFAPQQPMAWASTATELLRSSDNGVSWTTQIMSPISGGITHLAFADSSSGWAVTNNGEVLHYSPLVLGVGTSPRLIPGGYSLAQNYPNPFNPATVISYQLPALSGVEGSAVSDVRLVVYDLLGREVAVLVDEREPAGTYEVRFDVQSVDGRGSGLASGVYIYRLTAGSCALSRKMVLLK